MPPHHGRTDLASGDGLLIVDVQNDFCPGGSLAVKDAHEIVPVLNDWIRRADEHDIPVFISRDWHPEDHMSFEQRGGPWPPHCIQGSDGARFHPELDLPVDVTVVSKGADPDRDAYSAFQHTGLEDALRDAGVSRLWIGGLALDVCVRATVLDALSAGFHVMLIRDATKPIELSPGDGDEAVETMRQAGARIIENDSGAQ